jgi:predicted Zn-dependent protease with MMP-like domain
MDTTPSKDTTPPAERPGPPGAVRRRRRDRRGRGLRRSLAPTTLPMSRTPAQIFDELVLDAVAHLQPQWGAQLAEVEFAVGYDSEIVDDALIPLGRVLGAEANPTGRSMIVIYRRPLESRAFDAEDLSELVLEVVVDRLAFLLGLDPDEIDPPLS